MLGSGCSATAHGRMCPCSRRGLDSPHGAAAPGSGGAPIASRRSREGVVAPRHPAPYAVTCCGQVKTDTTCSGLDDFFVRLGTDIPERRLWAPTVVQHRDSSDAGLTRVVTRPIIPRRGARTLHAAEQPRRARLVQASPRVPPAAPPPPSRPQVPGDLTGRRRAPGTLGPQARRWRAPTPRQRPGTATPWRRQRRAPRPAPPWLADRAHRTEVDRPPSAGQRAVTAPHHAPWGAVPSQGRATRGGAPRSP